MKDILKKGIILLSISILTLSFNVFAKHNVDNKDIIEIPDKSEIDKEITMSLNINEVPYDNFSFKLMCSESLENIYTEEQLDMNNDNEQISFNFSKNNSNINNIIFNYKLSENIKVDDKISFNIIITNIDDNNQIIDDSEIISIKKEVTIIDVKKDEIESDDNSNNPITDDKDTNKPVVDNKIKENTSNNKATNDIINDKTKVSNNRGNIVNISNNSVNIQKSISQSNISNNNIAKETIKYNGSDNNYLSSLSIKGYELNKEFSKESTTYFLTVNNDINSLDVSANKEDSNSSISINGNDNLNEGLNKILITVTSESKQTRTYRIYVTKESE